MPTTTLINDQALVNIGPLTTTFTAPSSCATVFSSHQGLALSAFPFGPNQLMEDCGRPAVTNCLPNGTFIDEDALSIWPAETGSAYRPIYYYSPADICPSGWATVGYVVKDADGDATESWDFEPAVTEFYDRHFSQLGAIASGTPVLLGNNFLHKVWADALAPEETGIACCPSGFHIGPYSKCYRTADITAYTAASACEAFLQIYNTDAYSIFTSTLTVFDLTVTAELWNREESARVALDTMWHSVPAQEDRSSDEVVIDERTYVAMEYAPVLLLATGGGGGGEATQPTEQSRTDGDGAASETAGDPDSAAAGGQDYVAMRASVTVIAAWVGAMMIGGTIAVLL